MQTIERGHQSLSLLLELNGDRVLYITTIMLALGAATWINAIIG
ncbi:hypothetical protein ROLI_023380 [Roseobacter fucihabitans]|uniref:Uncharacterized protein n=1 Tax=Roseobacter fucihabitans TaxID=1537242 RepID=A0ABZ2BT86_9RHOB|nr:hypothetical protein [Roseobacter litoralis]MBC6965750.1 hypothetical protein [Roseobacter litoralis]